LLTVLFTDIVDSTGWLARLGDQRWRELRTEHDILVRQALFDGSARAIRCASEIARQMRRSVGRIVGASTRDPVATCTKARRPVRRRRGSVRTPRTACR
jgi:class 3 adenylate cyclase